MIKILLGQKQKIFFALATVPPAFKGRSVKLERNRLSNTGFGATIKEARQKGD